MEVYILAPELVLNEEITTSTTTGPGKEEKADVMTGCHLPAAGCQISGHCYQLSVRHRTGAGQHGASLGPVLCLFCLHGVGVLLATNSTTTTCTVTLYTQSN